MIRNTDLFNIATSGITASNQLLSTTSHNIANVNTEGFVRERTNLTTQLAGGVGRATTERIINTFAQNQLRRDTTQLGENQTYYDRTSAIDNVLASEANSISSALSRFFGAIQTASDDPTNQASRQLVLGEANSLVGQIGTVSRFLDDKESELNAEAESLVNRANSLIESINELNEQVVILQGNNRFEEPGAVKNERDQAVLELAELLSIETRETAEGAVLVNLSSGESLVLQDGSFNIFQLNGDPDLNYKSLELTSTGKPTTLGVAETSVGGELGGLFRYREEVLEPAQREIGQIAMTLAAAANEQNRLGMDFDQQLGGNIFALPEFTGLPYADNALATSVINGRVAEDGASTLTSADYQITIDAVTAGAPPTVDITVALLNPDGTAVTDPDGNAVTQTVTGLDAQAGTFTPAFGGIEIEFPDGATYTAGDQFLLQPTKGTASDLTVEMTRPEDLAFASPFRVDSDLANLGDATLVSTTVTNTTVDNTFADADASAFDGAGNIHGPGASPTGGGGVGAPAAIRFTGTDDYEVLDSAGTVIVTVTGAADLENVLAQAAAQPGWPAAFSALNDYPGFDFSLQGVPQAGDVFNISYNTDGLNDNRNALELSGLQNRDIVQSNDGSTANQITFHETYAGLVSNIGEKAASADIALKSSEALQRQSQEWFDNISGVNLDEEAANLVRFQQSYSAAARILTTAQSLFDTILSSTR